VSLQPSENYFVLMFASLWDLYWCHETVSSTSTDTYHRSNILWLLFQPNPAQSCMTDHILVSPAECQTCAVSSSFGILFPAFHISCIQLGSYRSTQAAWLPALFSNGCFDILDLTESVDMLESPRLVVTVLAASDWDLVNSVTELSCLTYNMEWNAC
jgi:hypothetical protein